jgi:hypothetical protein
MSVHKPYVRPMVRGKGGREVEFGPKVSLGLVDGIAFVYKISYENYGEGEHLKRRNPGCLSSLGPEGPPRAAPGPMGEAETAGTEPDRGGLRLAHKKCPNKS